MALSAVIAALARLYSQRPLCSGRAAKRRHLSCIMDLDHPVISFLSDYGTQDEFVGVCHAVIARRCPRAHVIDITHAVPPQDVRTGARILRDCVRFMPAGVVLGVVDPRVGGRGAERRRAIALRARQPERLLVGPDNGLLMPAVRELGGVLEAVDIGSSSECLDPVSRTFHGRDIFAPVAAALAAGARLADVGERLGPGQLCDLELPEARVCGESIDVHVLGADRFGNVLLDASAQHLEQIGVRAGDTVRLEPREESEWESESRSEVRPAVAVCASTFADVQRGALLLYEDSRSMLALAIREGSAAAALEIAPGDELTISRA